MLANSFGRHLVMHSFGESHGPAMGVVVDGVPSAVEWNSDLLITELGRRRPGQIDTIQAELVTARAEADAPKVLSGVFDGKTLGTPIAIIVDNQDARSADYTNLQPRAGHADDLWREKFGHVDPRGGGRSSGRETVSRVIAGSIAQMFLKSAGLQVRVLGFSQSISKYSTTENDMSELNKMWSKQVYPQDQFFARFPSKNQQNDVRELLIRAKEEGRSYGGVVEIWIDGVPSGLGQPVFNKLKSNLAEAMMSVGAVNGVEFGSGFNAAIAEGTSFHRSNAEGSDPYGGIRGGISTGERICLRVSFKPTSSVLDVAKRGRHDPCILPRAIPVLEAMAYFVIADQLMLSKLDTIQSFRDS